MELAPLEHQARHNVDVSAKGISWDQKNGTLRGFRKRGIKKIPRSKSSKKLEQIIQETGPNHPGNILKT